MIVKDCYATFFLRDGSRIEGLFKGSVHQGFAIPPSAWSKCALDGIKALRFKLRSQFIDIANRIQRVEEIASITFVETEREETE